MKAHTFLAGCAAALLMGLASCSGNVARTGGSAGSGNSAGQCSGSCPLTECWPSGALVDVPGMCCPVCVPGGTGGSLGTAGSAGYGTAGYGTAGYDGAPGAGGFYGTAGYPGDAGYPGTAGYSGTAGSGGSGACASVYCDSYCGADAFVTDVPGSCCSACLPKVSDCSLAQKNYSALHDLLLTPTALACATNLDCVWLQESSCGRECSGWVANQSWASWIQQRLVSYGSQMCASCDLGQAGASSTGGCGPMAPATCVNGVCQATFYTY